MAARAKPARANPIVRVRSKIRILAGVIAKKRGSLLQLPRTKLDWKPKHIDIIRKSFSQPLQPGSLQQGKVRRTGKETKPAVQQNGPRLESPLEPISIWPLSCASEILNGMIKLRRSKLKFDAIGIEHKARERQKHWLV